MLPCSQTFHRLLYSNHEMHRTALRLQKYERGHNTRDQYTLVSQLPRYHVLYDGTVRQSREHQVVMYLVQQQKC